MILYRILFLCLLSTDANAHTGGRAKQLYKEGLQMKREGRLDEAQLFFSAAIRANNRFADAYLELAAVHRMQQQSEQARQSLLELLQQEPEHPQALKALAEVYFAQHCYEDALAYAWRAEQQEVAGAYRIIGESYAQLDHPEEAIQALSMASAEGEQVNVDLARLYAQQEDYKQSIRYYERALLEDSTSETLFFETGMMHFNMENYQNAVVAFEHAVRLGHVADADLYLNLGMAHLKQANYMEAVRNLRTALTLRPNNIQVMLSLANAYYKQQDFRNAIVQWNNILVLQPMNGFAMFMLGKSYICSGDLAKGQAICDQAMTLGSL